MDEIPAQSDHDLWFNLNHQFGFVEHATRDETLLAEPMLSPFPEDVMSVPFSSTNLTVDNYHQRLWPSLTPDQSLQEGYTSGLSCGPYIGWPNCSVELDQQSALFHGPAASLQQPAAMDIDPAPLYQPPGMAMQLAPAASMSVGNDDHEHNAYVQGFIDASLSVNAPPMPAIPSVSTKRQKKLQGGYLCPALGCDEVFNRACDLRKHEQRRTYRGSCTSAWLHTL